MKFLQKCQMLKFKETQQESRGYAWHLRSANPVCVGLGCKGRCTAQVWEFLEEQVRVADDQRHTETRAGSVRWTMSLYEMCCKQRMATCSKENVEAVTLTSWIFDSGRPGSRGSKEKLEMKIFKYTKWGRRIKIRWIRLAPSFWCEYNSSYMLV